MEAKSKKTTKDLKVGRIIRVLGAVIDVQFSEEHVPDILNALQAKIEEQVFTFEVQQQIGDGVVRTIAMDLTVGLYRGLEV